MSYTLGQLKAALKIVHKEKLGQKRRWTKFLEGYLRTRTSRFQLTTGTDQDASSNFKSKVKKKVSKNKEVQSDKESPKRPKGAQESSNEDFMQSPTSGHEPGNPQQEERYFLRSRSDVGVLDNSDNVLGENFRELCQSRADNDVRFSDRSHSHNVTTSETSFPKFTPSPDRTAEQFEIGAQVPNVESDGKHHATVPEGRHNHAPRSLPQNQAPELRRGAVPECDHKTKPLIYSTIIPNLSTVRNKTRHRPGPSLKIISTSFAHPIDFAYSPPADGSSPCHWCYDFTYGLLGFEPLQIRVEERPNGGGYVEVEDGHTLRGKEPSRMCTGCATERLSVIGCASHILHPITGLDERNFDFDRAIRTLFPDLRTGRCVQTNPWCALCISPAFYRCASHSRGCGLVLCGNCARRINAHGGGLSQLVVDELRASNVNLRADAEFLLPEGELYRRFDTVG
ncbi:hypothetical protein PRK78_002500 [Emydomyces testavorans]|uniref:Uncharacterized protein n=1 Tax=Emydomyces testavorans TaxID=2070801 RepID=A0AAF0IHV2_9EURO|nr:hypothetical protein PRK78_002500 [Emydomyces testavorans]